MTASMPSVPLSRTSFARSAWYRARSPRTSISSEMSSRAWPYLMAPARWWATFHRRNSASVFTGAAAPSEASHALKSRFMPYLNTTEQSASFPFALSSPPQVDQLRKFDSRSLVITLGMSAGSTMIGSLLLQNLDGLGHHLGLRLVQAAPRLARARRRDPLVEERARDADPRALQGARR